MENTKSRLHPLLTAAAISVTVFSAVGVATLTGLVPQSIGSHKEAAQLQIPAEVAKPLEPAITHPVAKPVKKPVPKASAPRKIEPVVYRDFAEEPRLAQAGAVIGNQFGHGTGKKIMTVLGAAGGAYAGREIEKQARATKRWEIEVRHDSGTQETVLSEVAPPFNAGDRVRVLDGRLQPV